MDPAYKALGFVPVSDVEHVTVVPLTVIVSVVPGHLLGNVDDLWDGDLVWRGSAQNGGQDGDDAAGVSHHDDTSDVLKK